MHKKLPLQNGRHETIERNKNKVKPNTLMVFAFVLILFGFY